MGTPISTAKAVTKTLGLISCLSLTGLISPVHEASAAKRPVRPGGSTPPPTVVNPNPPPRPSQMVAGRNAGNMVLSTPLLPTAPPAPRPLVTRVTTDP